MTEYRGSSFGQETPAEAKEKADAAKQEADEKKIANAKAKKEEGAHTHTDEPKADAKVVAKAEKAEEKEEPKARKSLPEQLNEVVTKLEKRTSPFSSEERVELQGVQKRLSRTLGDYRDPNPE